MEVEKLPRPRGWDELEQKSHQGQKIRVIRDQAKSSQSQICSVSEASSAWVQALCFSISISASYYYLSPHPLLFHSCPSQACPHPLSSSPPLSPLFYSATYDLCDFQQVTKAFCGSIFLICKMGIVMTPHLAAVKSEWSHLHEAIEPFLTQTMLDMCPLFLLLFSHFCFPSSGPPCSGKEHQAPGWEVVVTVVVMVESGDWGWGDCECPWRVSNGCEWGQISLRGRLCRDTLDLRDRAVFV